MPERAPGRLARRRKGPSRRSDGGLPTVAGEKRAASRPLQVDVVSRYPADARGLGAWLRQAAPARARGEVTIALVADGQVRALNRRFRAVDRATDVLSFPADEPGRLGDVVIARGVARRQAREVGHALSTELRVLALHGLLHLLGYDHETDNGEMARYEGRLRRRAGLAHGLIERAATPAPSGPRSARDRRP